MFSSFQMIVDRNPFSSGWKDHVEFLILLKVGVGSEGSCFRGSTQELAQTRWITNIFNYERISTS